MRIRQFAVAGAVLVGVLAATGCGPAPTATGFSCQGVGGLATVSPGLSRTPTAQDVQLNRDGGLAFCVDRGHSGITSGHFVTPLTIHFNSLGCASPVGTGGSGTGAIRWQNWALSYIDVVAVVAGPGKLTLTLTVTGGPFDGTSATIAMTAIGLAGDCTAPITKGFVGGGPVQFTNTQVAL